MRIGLPKEIKDQEFRVGLAPASVQALCQRDHQVVVEENAGCGAGFTNADYAVAGQHWCRIQPYHGPRRW